MNPKFLVQYIGKCAKEGITSNEEIHKKLKEEILSIDKELSKVEHLRIERSEKQKVLEHISALLQTDKMVSDFNDESEELLEIKNSVIEFVRTKGSATNREICTSIGYNQDAKVIRAIKILGQEGVLDRDKSDRTKLIPGQNWS